MERLQPRSFYKGEVIISKDQIASRQLPGLSAPGCRCKLKTARLYVIESGSVLVQHREDEQAQQVLAGTSFGMDTILFDEPYDLQALGVPVLESASTGHGFHRPGEKARGM